MDLALVVTLAVTAVLLAVACGLLAVALTGSRRAGRALEASQAEAAALAARIEQLERAPRAPEPVVPETGFLITDVGTRHGDRGDDPSDDAIRTQMVLSSVVAEPLVKALAFGYGVRRALSPQNRNRIRFEVRREVRRARKLRRRDARRAARQSARQSTRQAAA